MRALRLLRRAVAQPRLVLPHLRREGRAQAERWLAPWREGRFDTAALLRATAAASIETLWERLAARPFLVPDTIEADRLESLAPGSRERIASGAQRALARRVRLLGSPDAELGRPIDWSRDFKAGRTWPRRYFRDLTLVYPEDESDVKIPWELSRLQWALPLGQAYRLLVLSEDGERLAVAARELLDEWIAANPYARSINWGVAMEAALRIVTWSFLFHSFKRSDAWADPGFRARFLCALFLHGDFVDRHFEEAGINGNHYTADAVGLVFAGLLFGAGRVPQRWLDVGWERLVREMPKQVHADGVDFEASSAYHRLVMELFLLAGLFRRACGLPVPAAYRERLVAMARFVAAYTRPDGSAPNWGDADDGRVLPLGGQELNDHRYLIGIAAEAFDVPELRAAFSGPLDEVCWLLGPEAAERLAGTARPACDAAPGEDGHPPRARSAAFPAGGVFVMRTTVDHVFIDCGPVGLGGFGGHGHNDCLSFEAYLAGVPLVSDCGTFVYSADLLERDRFRSSRSHNAPVVDGQEANRLDLGTWAFRNDARPELRRFEPGTERDVFVGAHAGYRRLADPVTPVRTLVLDRIRHGLVVRDAFEGRGRHRLEVPLHLAHGAAVAHRGAGRWELVAGQVRFLLAWGPVEEWRLEEEPARLSPSYGVTLPCARLAWRREGSLDVPLVVAILPAAQGCADPLAWAHGIVAEAS